MIDLADYAWLVSDAAAPWLAAVATETTPRQLPQLASRLRRELSAARAHLVLEQAELRRRARDKFPGAADMFFTRTGLEQATDHLLARLKSERYAGGIAVADLCCGIGGDLLGLAERGPAVAVERDPATALLAAENVRRCWPAARIVTHVDDAERFDPRGCPAWHIDPDRRVGGRKAADAETFSPPLAALARLREVSPAAGVKLAPATQLPAEWSGACEREWLGARRECRQQMAWLGPLARHPGRHVATMVFADDAARDDTTRRSAVRAVVGLPDVPVPTVDEVGRFVYEPHAAVLAARLTGEVAALHHLAAPCEGVAYLSGPHFIDDVALSPFEVLDVLPLDLRRIGQAVRRLGLGLVEVKQRGAEFDPARLSRQWSRREGSRGVVLLARGGRAARAIVARRVERGA